MNNLSLQLISPDKEYFAGIVEMVVLPGENGDFSVLPDHAPIITYLRPGKISIIVERGKELSYFVASGFVKVDNNNCHVLVDYIKSESDLNESDCMSGNYNYCYWTSSYNGESSCIGGQYKLNKGECEESRNILDKYVDFFVIFPFIN